MLQVKKKDCDGNDSGHKKENAMIPAMRMFAWVEVKESFLLVLRLPGDGAHPPGSHAFVVHDEAKQFACQQQHAVRTALGVVFTTAGSRCWDLAAKSNKRDVLFREFTSRIAVGDAQTVGILIKDLAFSWLIASSSFRSIPYCWFFINSPVN